MKLHDLRPAAGARSPKRRVGRGIAAGQGKTAGRGTKGQKARAGGAIPAWFEGGQTPLHQRIPKLHGFRNPFRVGYEIVNVGDIAKLVELGVLESGELPGAKAQSGKARAKTAAPVTVNQELLRATGLVRTLDRPMKVLGGGELSTPLFVVADAFSASARAKIEAAGGTASVIEVTGRRTPAIGIDASAPASATTEAPTEPASAPPSAPAEPSVEPAPAVEPASPGEPAAASAAAKAPAARRRKAASESAEPKVARKASSRPEAAAEPSEPRASAQPETPAERET